MRIARNIRRGFTLIEMLVAMALTLFVMVILSQAFATALETFRGLKAIGDMQQSLRIAQTALTADLSADHFETGRKLSDANIVTDRPREGYFFIRQWSAVAALGSNARYQYEGADADGLPSTRSYDQVIAFTVRLRGNTREKFMMTKDIPWYQQPAGPPPRRKWSPLTISSANLVNKSYTFFGQERDALFNFNPLFAPTNPANYVADPTLPLDPTFADTYSSHWAEVAYFLLLTGTTDDPTNPGVGTGNPLFGLYRAQHLLVPRTDTANQLDSTKQPNDETLGTTQNTYLINSPYYYAGVSCNPGAPLATGQLNFNAPLNVADTTTQNAWTINGVPFRTQGMANRVLSTLSDPTIALPLDAANFPYGTAPASPPRSSTLVVPNVVSFNIQVLYAGASGFTDIDRLPIPPPPNPPPNIYLHDTTLANSQLGLCNRTIVGLKITVRVFDSNTRMTRQLSVIQDM
jgi:prepilin-type N-terminal cleavage/methylation domain-containing protein